MVYDEKYPWRPTHNWDKCPGCFEVFDFDFKCDRCGHGHADYKPTEQNKVWKPIAAFKYVFPPVSVLIWDGVEVVSAKPRLSASSTWAFGKHIASNYWHWEGKRPTHWMPLPKPPEENQNDL